MVGCVGFVIDAGVLSILTGIGTVTVLLARAVSFCTATIATWLLNRYWTFSQEVRAKGMGSLGAEYGGYLAVQIVGMGINFSVFIGLITTPVMRDLPAAVPLAGGATVSALVTFHLGRWVLRRPGLGFFRGAKEKKPPNPSEGNDGS